MQALYNKFYLKILIFLIRNFVDNGFLNPIHFGRENIKIVILETSRVNGRSYFPIQINRIYEKVFIFRGHTNKYLSINNYIDIQFYNIY